LPAQPGCQVSIHEAQTLDREPTLYHSWYLVRILSKRIEQIWFKPSDNIFIVGGDIEAYYPSVPTPEAVKIMKKMMEVEPHSETQAFKSSFFNEYLDVANSTIVM
jgi:hypothetical protein